MNSEPKQVEDLEVGQKAYGDFLVKNIKKGLTTQNKEYLDIELGDKTGTVLGKLWDIAIEAEQVEVGDVVYATGAVTEWQGTQQFKLDYIEKKTGVFDAADFVKTAPYTGSEMNAYVENVIEQMVDTEIQSIVGHIYLKHREEFLVGPAARGMHHAIYGGLAYHTITMLKTADKLLDVYGCLNRDLLFGGIILHDIAKVIEMKSQLGTVTDYTRGGYLLGHIVQGTMMIELAAVELNIDSRTKEILQHMVVSHHDKGEWGSPVSPRVPEAVLLHFIDNIDAKMFMVKELMDGKMDGEYTDYHKGLRQKLVIY